MDICTNGQMDKRPCGDVSIGAPSPRRHTRAAHGGLGQTRSIRRPRRAEQSLRRKGARPPRPVTGATGTVEEDAVLGGWMGTRDRQYLRNWRRGKKFGDYARRRVEPVLPRHTSPLRPFKSSKSEDIEGDTPAADPTPIPANGDGRGTSGPSGQSTG
jgi:hypothetical protein